MSRFLAFILAAAALSAQSSVPTGEKPPAKVDAALKARIAAFYQAYVDGHFRDAETIVAADTKNFFYAAAKPQFLSFQIQSIRYSNKFTRATALTLCRQQMLIPGFTGEPVPVPVTSDWKLEKGKWVWFVDQTAPQETPFGKMAPPSVSGQSGSPIPTTIPDKPDFALHKVSADRETLMVGAGESAAVTLSNSAQGPMGARVYSKPEGVEVSPVSAQMARDGKATFTVKALSGAQTGVLTFRIEPTQELLEVKIAVK